jgi:hypothetical protein
LFWNIHASFLYATLLVLTTVPAVKHLQLADDILYDTTGFGECFVIPAPPKMKPATPIHLGVASPEMWHKERYFSHTFCINNSLSKYPAILFFYST